MRLKLIGCLIVVVVFLPLVVFSQNIPTNSDFNISELKADNLSDEQVQQFVKKYESSGLSWDQVESIAISKGANKIEVQKLKQRIDSYRSGQTQMNIRASQTDLSDRLRLDSESKNISQNKEAEIDSTDLLFQAFKPNPQKGREIFGMSLFSNKNLTFYPNLNIPTPKNYVIGPGDELIVDVWGASQNTYQKIINPEGSFLIPEIGHIYISGMTIEEATMKIKKELSQIYSGLLTGNTFVKLSIGSTMRSIKVFVSGDVNLPGGYTIPSLASVYHALYIAAGPSENGTLRNIKVIRNNKVISELDVYSFLMRGEQSGGVRLEDQDVIFVSPYSRRVLIDGQVKRPAFYDIKENETLNDLFEFCGGFTTKAYTLQYMIERKKARYNRIINVSSNQADTFKLDNGDHVTVDSIIDKYDNRVEINGAVYRPGFFGIGDSTNLLEIIEMADGLKGDAFLSRATIFRTNDDYTTELLSVDLSSVLKKETTVLLKKDDIVKIYSIFDLKEEYSYHIEGEVQNPGDYYYSKKTTLEDLIAMAGGFKESASEARIEVARRIKKTDNTSGKTAEIFYFTVPLDLKLNQSASNFELNPFDQVYVRRAPTYEIQKNVFVSGEVTYPGAYAIASKEEYISDLIERAGGLTKEAYTKGATLVRKKTLTIKKRELVLETLNNLDSLGIDTSFTDEKIGIELDKIIENPKTNHDLLLKEGDILQIPQKLQTVSVNGSVLYPVSVKYSHMWGLRKYVSMAGGFNEKAKRSNTYVIYPNGSIRRTHNYVFFKIYPYVEPGSEIVVPMKEPKQPLTPEKFIGIGTSLVSLVSLVVIITTNLNKP